MKRFWRIFPPYYFSIAVVMAIYLTGAAGFFIFAVTPTAASSEVWGDFAYHVFYLQNYTPVGANFQNGIYWSLAVEEQFYITAPLFLYLLGKPGNRHVLYGLIALIVIGVSIRFALYDPSRDWTLEFLRLFHTRFDSLAFGMLAALVFIRYRERLDSLKSILPIFLIAGICLLVCIKYGKQQSTYFSTCWQFTLSGFGFSALILGLMLWSKGRFFRSRAIGYIAKVSYSMYLYHLLLIAPVVVIAGLLGYDKNSLAHFFIFFAVYYIFVVFVSGAVYRLIDKPCLDYRSKLDKKYSNSGSGETLLRSRSFLKLSETDKRHGVKTITSIHAGIPCPPPASIFFCAKENTGQKNAPCVLRAHAAREDLNLIIRRPSIGYLVILGSFIVIRSLRENVTLRFT